MQTHILGYPRIGSKRELKKPANSIGPAKLFWKNFLLQEERSVTTTGISKGGRDRSYPM